MNITLIKWLGGGLVAVFLVTIALTWRGEAQHYKKLLVAEKVAHATDIANYKTAALEAARLDKANLDRVTKEQTAITEKVSHDYESKLADSSDRYERLRAKAAGYLSRPQNPGLPEARDTTCQAVAGTNCEDLPPLLKAAQDNTDQLIALQAWVRAQSAVSTNDTQQP